MSVPSYPFHSLPLKLQNKRMNFLFSSLKLPNKGMDFPFPPLKLPNKRMKEYSKIILFIPFHSIPFPPPKRGLSNNFITNRFPKRHGKRVKTHIGNRLGKASPYGKMLTSMQN